MRFNTLLAIETSTSACSVALLYQQQVYQRYELLPQKHAHRLLEMVDEVLGEAGIDGSAIECIAYGEGPGAFTGVRITAGVVQGLALGWEVPVMGISSLEAMADRVLSEPEFSLVHSGQCEQVWCALMDARMKEVYFQSGTVHKETHQWQVSKVCLVSPEKAEEMIKKLPIQCIGLGDIAQVYPQLTAHFKQWCDVLPSALAVARIARRSSGASTDIALPVYLRNHVADTIEERKQK